MLSSRIDSNIPNSKITGVSWVRFFFGVSLPKNLPKSAQILQPAIGANLAHSPHNFFIGSFSEIFGVVDAMYQRINPTDQAAAEVDP